MMEGEPKFNSDIVNESVADIESSGSELKQGKEQLSKNERTKISRFFKRMDSLAVKVFGESAVNEVKKAYKENVKDLFVELVDGVKENGLLVKLDELDKREKKKIIAYGFRTMMVLGGVGAALAPEEAEAEELKLDVPDMGEGGIALPEGEDVEFVLWEDEDGNTQWDIESSDSDEITAEKIKGTRFSLVSEADAEELPSLSEIVTPVAGANAVGKVEETNDKSASKSVEESNSVDAEIEYQGGTSVWKEAEKQLQARFAEKFSGSDLSDAERTYDIDKVKDLIEKHPEQYGLPKDINFNKMSTDQIASVDWDKAIEDSGIKIETIDPHLSEEAEKNIIENNEKIAQWAKDHPGEQLDSERVDAILEAEDGEKVVKPTPPPASEAIGAAPEDKAPEAAPEPSESLFDSDRKGLTQREIKVRQAILDYNREPSQGTQKFDHAYAARIIENNARSSDFLKYPEFRQALQGVSRDVINQELEIGRGLFHFGKGDSEKIFEAIIDLARGHNMQAGSERLFVNWLAGEDGALDRHDFERLDLLFKQGPAKHEVDARKFQEKIDEFYQLAHSKDLPKAGWEPRFIYYEENGVIKEDIINVRESKIKKEYELDNEGDGIPNTKPNGDILRVKGEKLKNWFEKPVSGGQAQSITETAPAPVAPSESVIDYGSKLGAFNFKENDKQAVEEFLEKDLETNEIKEIKKALDKEKDVAGRSRVLKQYEDSRSEYIEYKLQELAKKVIDEPKNSEVKKLLEKFIDYVGRKETSFYKDNNMLSRLENLVK